MILHLRDGGFPVTLRGVGAAPGDIRLLGSPDALASKLDGSDLRIVMPGTPPAEPVSVFELTAASP